MNPKTSIKTLFFACLLICTPLRAQTLGYVLQAEKLAPRATDAAAVLAGSGRDIVVVDEFFSEGAPWTPAQIKTIRNGKDARKVLAYLSIGEAENYRPYWKAEWAKFPPEWLLDENPGWPGNFRVKYWDPQWQKMILDALGRITAAGFDGVYLDIVDAFELFEYDKGNWRDHRSNPETGRTYREDMVAWVQKIAKAAREVRPDFRVVPQNGVQLLADPAFARTVSAAGVESLFTDGRMAIKPDDTTFRKGFLLPFLKSGKPVFVIEYPARRDLAEISRAACRRNGFSLLLTGHNLDRLGEAFAREDTSTANLNSAGK